MKLFHLSVLLLSMLVVVANLDEQQQQEQQPELEVRKSGCASLVFLMRREQIYTHHAFPFFVVTQKTDWCVSTKIQDDEQLEAVRELHGNKEIKVKEARRSGVKNCAPCSLTGSGGNKGGDDKKGGSSKESATKPTTKTNSTTTTTTNKDKKKDDSRRNLRAQQDAEALE